MRRRQCCFVSTRRRRGCCESGSGRAGWTRCPVRASSSGCWTAPAHLMATKVRHTRREYARTTVNATPGRMTRPRGGITQTATTTNPPSSLTAGVSAAAVCDGRDSMSNESPAPNRESPYGSLLTPAGQPWLADRPPSGTLLLSIVRVSTVSNTVSHLAAGRSVVHEPLQHQNRHNTIGSSWRDGVEPDSH